MSIKKDSNNQCCGKPAPQIEAILQKIYTVLIAYIFKPCISDCIPAIFIKPFSRSQFHADADITAHQKPSISYKTAYSNSQVIMSAKG